MTSGATNRYYALAVITSVYTLNLVDRQLVVLLLQPIKVDLHLTDTQLGFLTGIAFGVFYATLGIPIARWADRGNRATITSLAIGLWGLTVMACTLVTSYAQLIVARMGAAIGESGAKPPTYSLVGDYFPEPAARTRAMTLYLMSSPLSALVSLPLGGLLNELYGWRTTFFLMGIPGLCLAVLVKLTVADPRTQASAQPLRRGPGMGEVLSSLWRQPSGRHLTMALTVLYTMGLGLTPWYGAFLTRSHGMQTRELGSWLGIILSVGGMAGIFVGGFLSNRLFLGNERGQMRMTALAMVLLLPCFAAFLLLPSKHESLAALGILMVVFSVYLAPTYVLLQRLVAAEVRATVMAVVMLLANLIGMGVGPQIVGSLSDHLLPVFGEDSLRYAMLITSTGVLWCAYHFWHVSCTVQDDLSRPAACELPRFRKAESVAGSF
jgi:predicted MFS family arabinose efflux permease